MNLSGPNSFDRITRVNEILRREIAESLYLVIHDKDFDIAAITVTHVVASRNLRHARVLVSVRDGTDEAKKQVLKILRKYRREIQTRINADLVMKYTPRLHFQIDTSIARGDNMLQLLAEMDDGADPSDPPPGYGD